MSLSIGPMAQVLIHGRVDIRFHEPDRAVAEREIGSVAIVRAAEPANECRTHPAASPN